MTKKNVKTNTNHGVIGKSADLVEVVMTNMDFGKEKERSVQDQLHNTQT